MLALRYQNIKWIVIPVNKRISASLRCVSRLLYLFANRQRQASSATAAALASLPPIRRGIDQNVYTYARFSFNNSSNALSAHKKLWHSTFVFDCVCKMCEAIGRGRRRRWELVCKLWQCRQHSHWHLQIRPRPPLCRIQRWHINHRQNCLCVYVCVCWPKLHICLCVYMPVCVCLRVLSFKIFILLCALAGPHWRLNTITQIEFSASSS